MLCKQLKFISTYICGNLSFPYVLSMCVFGLFLCLCGPHFLLLPSHAWIGFPLKREREQRLGHTFIPSLRTHARASGMDAWTAGTDASLSRGSMSSGESLCKNREERVCAFYLFYVSSSRSMAEKRKEKEVR